MHVLFISRHDDPQAWREALAAELPGIEFSAWPDVKDKKAVDVALVWKPPPGVLSQLPNLRLICALGMGVDFLFEDPDLPLQVPIARLIDKNLIGQMAEYVCLGALYHHRRIGEYDAYQQQHNWRPLPPPDTAKRRVGILGLGTIGAEVAHRLRALGFPVQGWSRGPKSLEGVESFHGDQGLKPFLQTSEVLVCLLPLTPETEGIVDAETLAALPRGAYVINVARGGHVVEEDLLAALDSGHLAGAMLDVFRKEPLPAEHPFWSHPKVRITPHIAGLTRPEAAVAQIAENIRRLRDGRPIRNRVDPDKRY